MTVHNIIDVSPLYHKYAYAMRDREWIKNHTEDDIPKDKVPLKYLVLAEIEDMRKAIEAGGANVVTSACFDSKRNLRKELIKTEESSNYKKDRHSALVKFDFEEIEDMKRILDEAGVNVFCKDGCEADDLIAYLATKSEEYNMTIIYSTDKDMIANVHGTVGMRRRVEKSWISIDSLRYEQVVENTFGVRIPNNAIGLYLSTVGDSADKISGIKGFGKKAFEKLVDKLNEEGSTNWSEMYNYDKVRDTLVKCLKLGYITEEQFRQAVQSFNMVRPIEVSNVKEYEIGVAEKDEYGFIKIKAYIEEPSVMKVETEETRIKAYTKAGMPSLAK